MHDPLAPGLPPPAPWRPWSSFLPDSPRRQAERDLEVARRLGYWFTAEDRQWVREQERAEALVRRSAAIQQATRVGTVGVLVAAWAFPPLWPLAVVASFRVFPRTSRRLLVGLLGVTGTVLVGGGVMVHQLIHSQTERPALPPVSQPVDLPYAR